MKDSELAKKLASSTPKEQTELLKKFNFSDSLSLAEELKKLCYEAWLVHPETTKRIVSAFQLLKENSLEPEVKAFALWSSGIGEILEGRMRTAIEFFDKSQAIFLSLNQAIAAAETQVGKLYALAVLGLYDEAVECGLNAREIFLSKNEFYSAGKIEHNLGNIYLRRDRYDQAEHFFRIARERFDPKVDFQKLIQIDNSLANSLANQHKFREAERIYEWALDKARGEKLEVTKAEIESSLGHLLTFQGRLDGALKYFESSRRRFEKMNLPHQTAMSEQEIADAYLELNLAPESAAIYERVAKVFEELGMKSEKAKTLANFARSLTMLGETAKAHGLLAESQKIYASAKNFVGEATVKFIEAKLFYSEKDYRNALEKATFAEAVLIQAKFFSRAFHCRWLRGETLRLLNEIEISRDILQTALDESHKRFLPQITLRCLTSLGQIEVVKESFSEAENYFKQAISLVEEMRSPLAAEDFRTAFLADKLTPFNELIRLCLKKGETEKAFMLAENARSRVLLEMLDGEFSFENLDESRRDLPSVIRLEKLREELNWLYSNLNRLPFEADFDAAKIEKLQAEIRERENEILEINRKQHIFAENFATEKSEKFDLETLQKNLGEEAALIEFLFLDGKLSAFVITNEKIEALEDFANETTVFENLENLRFQIDAMKSGAARKSAFQDQMIVRTKKYLSELYTLLLRPLKDFTKTKKLTIVPHGILHYVPFHALFDGENYVIENREVAYVPSAKIFLHCLEKRRKAFNRAVIIGVEDELTPNVHSEIETLFKIFPDAKILVDEMATLENLKRNSSNADILHLACHGNFRPDNPLFSSLQLHGEWLNVRDAYKLKLDASLVVLSACETGINTIAIGNELLGLTRGLLSAGASSLVLSLWQVDDETTARLMKVFYEKLQLGVSPSNALRFAQIQIMQTNPHPFFWSPFVLIG